MIGLGIPLFSIVVRYNLFVGEVCSRRWSAFWGKFVCICFLPSKSLFRGCVSLHDYVVFLSRRGLPNLPELVVFDYQRVNSSSFCDFAHLETGLLTLLFLYWFT